MKTSISELISVIKQRLQAQPESKLTDPGLRRWLARKGYSKVDIDAALRVIHAFGNTPQRRLPGAVRQLSTQEAIKMSHQVRETLARLDLYEMLDPYTREMVIERLSQMEGEVGMDELDYALSWAYAPARDVESIQTLYNIFDGASETVH